MARLIAATMMLVAAPAAFADDAAKEWKALAGTWKVEKAEVEGVDQSDAFKTAVLTLADGKYAVKFGNIDDAGTVAVDPSKTPKAMDITGTAGVNKDKKFPCVYELKGDTLTVCYSLDDAVRPTKLETAKESKTMLIVYKRSK